MKTFNPSSVLETLESRLAPAGLVTLNLTAAGALTITGDADHNDFVITESGDQWTITALAGGATDTQFRLNGGAASTSLTFDAPLSVKAILGAGNDEMILDGISLPGALNVNTGDGDDILDLTSTALGGTATVVMGTGGDYFTAGGDLFFGRGLSVNLGNGSNTFEVNAASLTSNGNISALAGGTVSEGQEFLFKTGVGQVNGALTLRTTTHSFTDFEIGDSLTDSLTVTKAMTLQALGGEDIVTLRGDLNVGGLLALRMGNGANTVITTNLDELSSRGFIYTGGSGVDDFLLEAREVIIEGNFAFSAGSGTNKLDVFTSEYFGASGALTYTGGIGQDDLVLDGPEVFVGGIVTMNASSGSNSLGVNAVAASVGGVRYTGGTGTDIVDIGQFEGNSDLITVRGGVSISTGAGDSEVMVRNGFIEGNLSVITGAGFGYVDTVQFLESDFLSNVGVSLRGNADSDVIVRDSIFDRNVTVATGNGVDYVQFDTDTAVSSIKSIFHGYVRVLLGNGDDVFLAGHNPVVDTVGNEFKSYIDVDGGAGYDIAYFMNSAAYNNGFDGPLPWTYRVEDYA
ncbi:MAG: hypothetical protein V4672_06675 [Verrucomicrobiota bacterium]